MIVMTMKAKIKWIILGIVTAISLGILILVIALGTQGEQWAVVADLKYSLSAADEQERIAFLGQFGWTVDEEPVEVEEIVIPTEFNDVYTNYNQIQLEQGLDLTAYAGKTCKRWVYHVLNYPRDGERVLATLLVYDGKIIGGDISSTSLNGFMTGFLGEHGLMQSTSEESAATEESVAPTENSQGEERQEEQLPAGAYPTD